METAVIAVMIVLLTISSIGVYKGLDLRKWTSWFYAACAFVSGMLVGLLRADLSLGLMAGAIFAALILYGGATTQWHRRRYNKEMARSLLLRIEGKPALAALAHMLRRVLDK